MKVLYFARAREMAGTKVEEITVVAGRPVDPRAIDDGGGDHHSGNTPRDPVMVSDLLADLAERHGAEFASLAERSTIMVDDRVVPGDLLSSTPLGAEVAILPPVSGGDGPHGHGTGDPGHHGTGSHGRSGHDADGHGARGPGADGHDHSGHGADGRHHGGHRVDPDPGHVLNAAVLTVSDRASAGTYQDLTGPALVELIERRLPARVVDTGVVADSRELIAATVRRWCDQGTGDGVDVDLVVTNGGTGLSDRDVTPEALRAVLDVEAPGLGEVMRAAGLVTTPLAALSRQLGGRRARTVVLAVPGSVHAATESLEAVLDVVPHLCELAAEQRPRPAGSARPGDDPRRGGASGTGSEEPG